jgi:hypothetical protein
VNRRTFIGSLCAVLTSPLWGKNAAEPRKRCEKVNYKGLRCVDAAGHDGNMHFDDDGCAWFPTKMSFTVRHGDYRGVVFDALPADIE